MGIGDGSVRRWRDNSFSYLWSMPSLIPDFEYGIFISNRYKDNKYDGWVTGLVKTLRSEIEATFKEETSIYFDENPHEGLQTWCKG